MISVEFTQHIRFSLQHLYEISVLDKGPARALAPWLNQVSAPVDQLSGGQRMHQMLLRAIEQLKPIEPLDPNLPRHRSYLILRRRYVDGVSIQQLENDFNNSSRQFRRESHRAVEELVLALWNLSPKPAQDALNEALAHKPSGLSGPLAEFDRSASAINLLDLVVDAAQTLSVIITSAHTQLTADIPPDLPPVNADRVALRLALIKLLRVAIAHAPQNALRLRAEARADHILLTVEGINAIGPADAAFGEAAQLFALAEGTLALEDQTQAGPVGAQRIIARLSMHHQPAVLVVDDDPAMPRIIQRFLALKSVQVLSCTSTDDVVELARKAQPVLILLDVLMPKRDGWEVLQELKANPDTYHINLAVCSIWDERELAMSLGADTFFQKPIERAELLAHLSPYVE
jgi:CheY-like chemotaxis protein